jgi:hypothetical protein
MADGQAAVLAASPEILKLWPHLPESYDNAVPNPPAPNVVHVRLDEIGSVAIPASGAEAEALAIGQQSKSRARTYEASFAVTLSNGGRGARPLVLPADQAGDASV